MKILRYCPELNALTGGVTSTLLMMQLEYWFEKYNRKMFFKFLEACEDEAYREGDSWSEELGFSKGEFRTAFARIGKVYKSKKEFKESKDLFEGKLYLSYFDRIKRKTFYMRNDELINQVIESLGIQEVHIQEDTKTWGEPEMSVEKQGNENCRSEEMACPISIDYFKDYSINNQTESKTLVPYETIIDMYHEVCLELPEVKALSQGLRKRITQIWEFVEGDQNKIREMFQKVKQSDFLSGRLTHKFWKASLEWMLQVDKFIAIVSGKYDGREQIKRQEQPQKRFNRIANHNWDFNQLEALEQEYIAKQSESFADLKSPWLAKVMGSKMIES